MFNSKKQSLFETKPKTSAFVSEAEKITSETRSGNNAKKYSTTGNVFVDQFGKLGSYKAPRDFATISQDCETLWASSRRYTILFIFYIRMITRIVTMFNGLRTKESQKGAELKHEGIMRMIWLSFKDPDVFYNNIGTFISIGSWKDLFVMLRYDLIHHGWDGRVLNWDKLGGIILTGLNNENTVHLVKKYLPQLKAKSVCKTVESQANTMIAKWIYRLLFEGKNYKKYRKLKSSGTAHEWQQLISQGKHDLVDFSKIHGRALSLLVRGKYLFNQGFSHKYAEWVGDPETKVKYTGFVHELFQKYADSIIFIRSWNDRTRKMSLVQVPKHEQDTINKQFMTLVDKGGTKKRTNFIVVRDTSGSMGANATGTTMSCYDVAKALALYFSYFLQGHFSESWIEFHSSATMRKWEGNTPMEKWFNDSSGYVGSTNFLSVANLFSKIKAQGISEEEFPTGILCISDGEFNPAQLDESNVEGFRRILRNAGFSEEYVSNFTIVLWNLQSRYYGKGTGEKFETHGSVNNVFYFSGYSAATISFLDERVKTAEEVFENAMNQEILQTIKL